MGVGVRADVNLRENPRFAVMFARPYFRYYDDVTGFRKSKDKNNEKAPYLKEGQSVTVFSPLITQYVAGAMGTETRQFEIYTLAANGTPGVAYTGDIDENGNKVVLTAIAPNTPRRSDGNDAAAESWARNVFGLGTVSPELLTKVSVTRNSGANYYTADGTYTKTGYTDGVFHLIRKEGE